MSWAVASSRNWTIARHWSDAIILHTNSNSWENHAWWSGGMGETHRENRGDVTLEQSVHPSDFVSHSRCCLMSIAFCLKIYPVRCMKTATQIESRCCLLKLKLKITFSSQLLIVAVHHCPKLFTIWSISCAKNAVPEKNVWPSPARKIPIPNSQALMDYGHCTAIDFWLFVLGIFISSVKLTFGHERFDYRRNSLNPG